MMTVILMTDLNKVCPAYARPIPGTLVPNLNWDPIFSWVGQVGSTQWYYWTHCTIMQVSKLDRMEDPVLPVQGQGWVAAQGDHQSCLWWKPLRTDGQGESIQTENVVMVFTVFCASSYSVSVCIIWALMWWWNNNKRRRRRRSFDGIACIVLPIQKINKLYLCCACICCTCTCNIAVLVKYHSSFMYA